MADAYDPVTDALRLIEKLNAELSALSFVVSELLGIECATSSKPHDHLRAFANQLEPRLAQMPDEETAEWARQRLELVLSHAQDVLGRR
jgi:hypothetical protein